MRHQIKLNYCKNISNNMSKIKKSCELKNSTTTVSDNLADLEKSEKNLNLSNLKSR